MRFSMLQFKHHVSVYVGAHQLRKLKSVNHSKSILVARELLESVMEEMTLA